MSESPRTRLDACLERFLTIAQSHPGPAPWTATVDQTKHSRHVIFGAIMHGNEVGTLPAVLRVLDEVASGKLAFGGKLSVFLGNVPAALNDTRFVHADLNRVFTPEAAPSPERDRAFELMPLLRSGQVFFDLHQTLQPSTPFYTGAFHEASYLWARLAGGARRFITRRPGASFSANSLCGDEYARGQGVPSITIELGEKGFTPESETMAYEVMTRVVRAMERQDKGETLKAIAEKEADFEFLEITYKEPFKDRRMALNPGFANLSKVSRGQAIGVTVDASGVSVPLSAPNDGFVVFPKYPPRDASGSATGVLPNELFNFATTLAGHPRELYR